MVKRLQNELYNDSSTKLKKKHWIDQFLICGQIRPDLKKKRYFSLPKGEFE